MPNCTIKPEEKSQIVNIDISDADYFEIKVKGGEAVKAELIEVTHLGTKSIDSLEIGTGQSQRFNNIANLKEEANYQIKFTRLQVDSRKEVTLSFEAYKITPKGKISVPGDKDPKLL
ncbi:hypothetical protein NIES2109_35340 [Nostoc sp. HK-01]|nr:hypothetical protein NIES2109_35340 [Nostoc sp. HK-01]